MQEVLQYKIKGAEIKREKNGYLIVGFSSQLITNEQLMALQSINEKFFLAFYGCALSRSNLEILVLLGVSEVGIFHSSFCDADLVFISQSKALGLVKLHDTLVTQACIDEVRNQKPQLRIFI